MHFYRFIKSPEYLKTGQRMVFREGRTKAVGNISKLFPSLTPQNQQQQSKKETKMRPQRPQVVSNDTSLSDAQKPSSKRRGGRKRREGIPAKDKENICQDDDSDSQD